MDPLRILMLIGFFVVVHGEGNITSLAQLPSPSYLVVVSRVIQFGVPTTLSITLLNESSVLVKSEIIQGNRTLSQVQSIIEGGTTKQQVLPPISDSNSSVVSTYILNVTGYIGPDVVFSDSTMLQDSPRKFFILIQTDKPKYKPGQDVKIRVLITTSKCKPYNVPIDILIKDPQDNLILQWLHVDPVHGETSKEFQLSQNPSLGLWKIVAKVNGVIQEKYFTVSHYVLPKFEVLLDTPKVVYYKDMLNYTVKAQYLYEKPVAGNLSVVYYPSYQVTPILNESKTINGTTELSFNVSSLYQNVTESTLQYSAYKYIDIYVQVIELLTGVEYNSSVRVFINMSRYNLEFQNYPSFLKPSLNYSAELRLSTYNNSPLTAEDWSRNVTLNIIQMKKYSWEFISEAVKVEALVSVTESPLFNPYENISMQLPIPADGIIPFQINVSENVTMLTIKAQYEGIDKSLQLYRMNESPSRSYIQLKRSSSPQIGQPLYMTVQSNFPLTKFHYLVVSQGQVVDSGNLTSSNFSLSPNASWIPSATVVVYCVQTDREIVHDLLDVSFTKILQNNVSVSWAKQQAEPAEQVSLSISVAEPGSLVGVLVVDKASMDTDRSNDFTEKRVIQELTGNTKYGSNIEGSKFPQFRSLYMLNDLIVLTDGYIPGYYYPWFETDVTIQTVSTTQQVDPTPYQRHNFPETWLWFDSNMSDSTTATFNFTVPDSMTSWVATAFVISENLGLGLSAPVELLVSKNFFVSLNLPAYLVRGEQLLLEVNIFNYMDLDLEVLVTVAGSSMFEFVNSAANSTVLTGVRQVSVESHNSAVALFPIKVIQLGEMTINVSATSNNASDAISQKILVKPEGREQSVTQTLFLEFVTSVTKAMEFSFPSTTVPGSQRAQVTAVGDILGPSINGLDNLIQMPYGCGEQNMINFAPNVYVLKYMNSSGNMDENLRTKALSYMMQGYERELSYQRTDGSFSAFGNSDLSGSTWLSAFVLRCFLQAQKFIFIDATILSKVTQWLQTQQKSDGSFIEPGRVIHTELQGALDGPVSLTAYVLIALLEDVEHKYTNPTNVSAAINYLTTKLTVGIPSNYSLCLVTYALALANDSSAIVALNELMNRSQTQNGIPTWSTGGSSVSQFSQPGSADIEMASYTLLSLYLLGKMQSAIKIMKWLGQQRNHLGGYGSTQDTVVALQALTTFNLLSTGNINITITVTNETATLATFNINQTNYMVYQIQEIGIEQLLQLNVTAVGTGFALFQLTTFYNEESAALSRRRRATTCENFELSVDVIDDNLYNINLNICFRLCDNQELNKTGMAILDVGLLTGFILAQSGVPLNDLVRKVETPPGRVILYLDSVNKTKVCVEVPTIQDFKVAGVQDAVVTIYDYYEPRRKAMETYTSVSRKSTSLCSFCGVNCSQCRDTVSANPVTLAPATLAPATLAPATLAPVNVVPVSVTTGGSAGNGSDSSYYHQGLLKSLFLLLLVTFSFCF